MELEIFKSTFGYYNFRIKNGKPTESMVSHLKENGYRWSRRNGCWYPATDAAKERNSVFSAELRKQFSLEGTERDGDDGRIAYLENLIAELKEERKRDLEKISQLEATIEKLDEESMMQSYSREQTELDRASEWEKENALTDEEELDIARWSELEDAFSDMRTFRGGFSAIKAEVREEYDESGAEFTARDWQIETVMRILEENIDYGTLSETAEEAGAESHASRMRARLSIAGEVAAKLVDGNLSFFEIQEEADRLIPYEETASLLNPEIRKEIDDDVLAAFGKEDRSMSAAELLNTVNDYAIAEKSGFPGTQYRILRTFELLNLNRERELLLQKKYDELKEVLRIRTENTAAGHIPEAGDETMQTAEKAALRHLSGRYFLAERTDGGYSWKRIEPSFSLSDEGSVPDSGLEGMDIREAARKIIGSLEPEGKDARWTETDAERLIADVQNREKQIEKMNSSGEFMRMDEREQSAVRFLVVQHCCDFDRTVPLVDRLYAEFSPTEAFERAKVIPAAFGRGHEQTPEIDGKVLEDVIGIFDKSVSYHTVWDRKYAVLHGMSLKDASRLIEWNYSGGSHEFNDAPSKTRSEVAHIREQCREILKKPDAEITEDEKKILAQYEGAGGLDEENRTNAGILSEFYTPQNLVEKVWQIADAYAPEARTVLEPSAGTGRFADSRPGNSFTMHEPDGTSARINRLLHPEATVVQEAFQRQFFDDGGRAKKADYEIPKYDVVIGNPPYGTYSDKYKGLGEGKEFDRYEEYFIARGLDSLKDGKSVMAFVVPSGFLSTADDRQKQIIAEKGALVDAYRLPEGTFPTTDVGTDIVVFMKPDAAEAEAGKEERARIISGGEWFKAHPEKILGEMKIRTNRFGKKEEYTAVHEGLSVQDELDKITAMLPEAVRHDVERGQDGSRISADAGKIEKAYADAYPDNPAMGKELAEKFTEAVLSRNYHDLASRILWNGSTESAVARRLFGEIEGEEVPESARDAEIWLAGKSKPETVPEQCKFTSRENVVAYVARHGSGHEGDKERIAKAFAKHKSVAERAKFLSHEYGDSWYGVSTVAFEMDCTIHGIKVRAYITPPLLGTAEELNSTISYTELAKEIGSQIALGIYNDKKTTAEEITPDSPNERPPEDISGKPRSRRDKRSITKSKGEVMSAEEFSRLYGRGFDEREFPIWKATDWQGNIDLSKLSADDLAYLKESGKYVEQRIGEWTHRELFVSGDIYEKIREQNEFLKKSGGEPQYKKNIALLESVKKTPLVMENIHFGVKTSLAEEFKIGHIDADENPVELNLQESFILWAQNTKLSEQRWRGDIDFAMSNISMEELGDDLTFCDIVNYIDGKPVKAEAVRGWRTYDMSDEEKSAEKAERKKEADLKRQERRDVANRLFDRFLHEGLSAGDIGRLEAEYNRRFNSYVAPDYSKLPLFVDGMSAYKGDSKFKLYDQQIKGISFLCNKGNGILAYDVGVGKTAAGIVATVNQMQLGRSKHPLVIVPNQVYEKWYTDIRQLFPGIKVNDLYNLNENSVLGYTDKENPHRLVIPENSISLCTYEALKNISFTDESCEDALFEDFSSLLSIDFDGSERDNAKNSEKIKNVMGAASKVKDSSYYFFEDCGFDNLTVDEAHNFKNLWVVPRPKNKGESNEYSGIPSGKPSARALTMFAMTQLTQRQNNDRNVFMLSATPFTNSPTEVYSMLSYVGRKRLKQTGITSLRSFLDEFAQTKQEFVVTASGYVDTRQVMKSWKELPALQSILTEFIDKVDGEEAGIIRPNKFTHVKPLDMSEVQKQMREIDEERMADVKKGDSAAVIVAMNNMRLACVAPALANPAMYPGVELPPLSQLVETSPKLKFVCGAIINMYRKNTEKGQYMYVPLGKESHGIIKDYLVAHGIPKNAVEIINGEVNNSPEKKDKITADFNDVRNPLKIIIGGKNTSEGIDLNGNSFVMYNCSLGWNPSETVQAEGRIWRQGNLQGNVHIVYPVMNDSIDSVLYQKHDEKRSRINELWNYKGDSLNVEDINPEDLKLELIKDPKKKAKLVLQEETKEAGAELSHITLKIKTFDEIIEKRKQLELDFSNAKDMVDMQRKEIERYKASGLEIPEWIRTSLKEYSKDYSKADSGLEKVKERLSSLKITSTEHETEYIRRLNMQKRSCEEKIKHIEATLPQILRKLESERMAQKLTEYPVEKQREILEADILSNLRPMKEVEYEIRTVRYETMLAEKLKAGDITQEEHDLYKKAGYEKWQDGETESVEEAAPDAQMPSRTESGHRMPAEAKYEESVSDAKTSAGIVPGDEASAAAPSVGRKKAVRKESPSIYEDIGSLFFGLGDEPAVVRSAERPYFNSRNDDFSLSAEQLTQSERRRDEIIFPVLNGKETGMYKAFNNFAWHGVFDVQGTKIDMTDGAISADGFRQLHAAMNIYRSKEFETFRYVLIDRKSGEISDQLAVSSYMPDRCAVSMPDRQTLAQVVSRAEERDCLVIAVHNHPSGNVIESEFDTDCTKSLEKAMQRNDGFNCFAGHIILDHDSYNLYEPEKGWKLSIDWEKVGVRDEFINENFAFASGRTDDTDALSCVARRINDKNSWNDDFIPVVFSNAGNEVTGVKLYDRSFFNNSAQRIRNEFQFSGIEAGAVRVFPIVTEALAQKLSAEDCLQLEKKMKILVERSAFTDAALPESTVVEKYGVSPGKPLFDVHGKELKKPDIEATWEARINPALFPQIQHPKQKPPLKKSVGMEY